ncbi:hypothetical protein PCA20602_00701 [Pandoraea capi]|uniref:Uncharacterized protein n=1 Tax=Pandoraea capi TaxID=2508286 RepID=A0ABY6VPJ8_9BURK|nr:hypothetical protein PCA20602_00701 [Pandoraea capi]
MLSWHAPAAPDLDKPVFSEAGGRRRPIAG